MSENAAPASAPPSRPTGFGLIYWIANWMELVERFAYYGVRVVLPVLMVKAVELGGPEFDHIQKGTIYAVWALVQSFVPIFTGGFADRFGFKANIAVATGIKIAGYMLMGYCIILAEWLAGMPLAEARPLNLDHTYELFFAGSMLLAIGTAVFKPGLQGLIAHQMPKGKESVGWGLFYAMVNVGGFFGPLVAGYMETMPWLTVFLINTVAIFLNFVPLFFFKEPEHHGAENKDGAFRVLLNAFRGLLEPRLFFFTIAFAGFWLMFYQLFDILPNFIDDWVDSRGIASALSSVLGESWVPTVNAGNLTQAWMINANALLIICFAFSMGYLTGKVKALNAIIIGIGISAAAIFAFSVSANGWWTLAAICLFSVGEMTASPTKLRYLAGIAPPGKEGLYMGYVNFTVGIGWSVGSIIAGILYQGGGDKVELAKRYMLENGKIDEAALALLSKTDVLPLFEQTFGVDPWQTRDMLWDAYSPQSMWIIFTLIGVASMIGIFIYNKVVTAASKNPQHDFNLRGNRWVAMAIAPIALAFWFGTYYLRIELEKDWTETLAVLVQAIIFSGLFLLSLSMPAPEPFTDEN